MSVLDGHTHIFPPELIRKRDRIAGHDRGFAAIYGDRRARMADGGGLAAYMDGEGIDRVVAGVLSLSATRRSFASPTITCSRRRGKTGGSYPLSSSTGTMRRPP